MAIQLVPELYFLLRNIHLTALISELLFNVKVNKNKTNDEPIEHDALVWIKQVLFNMFWL